MNETAIDKRVIPIRRPVHPQRRPSLLQPQADKDLFQLRMEQRHWIQDKPMHHRPLARDSACWLAKARTVTPLTGMFSNLALDLGRIPKIRQRQA